MSPKTLNLIVAAALTSSLSYIAGMFLFTIPGLPRFLYFLFSHLSPAKLSFPFYNRFYAIGESVSADWLNLTLHLLLLAGAICFKKTNGGETRLLRFYFSIAFICKLINAVYTIYFLSGPNSPELRSISAEHWILLLLNFFVCIAIAYVSYKIVSVISHSKKLHFSTGNTNSSEYHYLTEATNWQRFFHWLLDSLICVAVISSISWLPKIYLAGAIYSGTGKKVALWVTIAVVRTVWFLLFESMFGATPAKFLTETRVTTYDGNKPPFTAILGRSLCRSIPMDSLSFLFNGRWHDKISHTHVLKEDRTGFKPAVFIWFVIAFSLVLAALWFGVEKYTAYKTLKSYQTQQTLKKTEMTGKLQHLTENYIIEAKKEKTYRSVFYKVEAVSPASITISEITMPKNEHTNSVWRAYNYWQQQKDTAKKTTVSKKVLEDLISRKFDYTKDHQISKTAYVFETGAKHEIVDLVRIKGPVISERSSYLANTSGGGLSLVFSNQGTGGRIVKLVPQKGATEFEMTSVLPFTIPSGQRGSSNTFLLNFKNYKPGKKFDCIIILEDETGIQYKYLLSAAGNSVLTITEFFE